MAVIRYYLPGVVPADVDEPLLGRLGLAERLWDCLEHGGLRRRLGVHEIVAKGPDGSSGSLLTPFPRSDEPVPRIGWSDDQSATAGEGDYWLISDPQHPPQPAGLERLHQLDGYVRRLGDGSHWMCPIVRSELVHTDLPREYTSEGGQVSATIQQRYRAIWLRSLKWCIRFLDQCHELPATKFLTAAEAFGGAVDCLALNYRVSHEELKLFPGLMTDEALTSILDAAIDWDFFRDVSTDAKKKSSLAEISAALANFIAGPEGTTSEPDPAEDGSNYSDAESADLQKAAA